MLRTLGSVVLRAGLLTTATLLADTAAAQNRFGWLGLPPASVGQTLQQAEAALKAPLLAEPGPSDAPCQRRTSTAQPGVVYVVDAGVITRVETRDPRYLSISGVRVGDDAAKARKLYGQRLTVRPHLYFDKGLRLSVYSPDGSFALVMESNDSGRIIAMRAGAIPAVEQLEGCSR
ncbi:MAG: hypothetical protein ABIR94_11620 [Rubrivivax sp.]